MASNGYQPGLLLPKDCNLMFPITGFGQGRPPIRRTYLMDKQQLKLISGFPESAQFMKLHPAFIKTMLADAQAEQFVSYEKLAKLLRSGTSGSEEDNLNLSLDELVEFQMRMTDSHHHQTMTSGNLSDSLVEMEQFTDDFPIQKELIVDRDGKISLAGSVNEMMDLASVLAEFYVPKGSARQQMLVPQFERVFEDSLILETLEAAPLMRFLIDSPAKVKPGSSQTRKTKKRAHKKRNIYQNDFYSACESFVRLIMDKKRDETAAIKSFKRSGNELHKILIDFSSTIAGAGVTVLLSVICSLAAGRVQFKASHFMTTSVGFGLFWLSWTMYKLRDTVVCIKRSPATLDSEEVREMVRRLDKSMNDIYRAAAFAAMVVLSLP